MNKSRLILASILVLLIVGGVYTQDATKKAKKVKVDSTQQNQEAPQPTPKEAPKAAKTTQKAPEATKATTANTAAQDPLKYFVFTESCFNKFINGQIDIECVKFTISKVLSYGIIGGSVLYKAPQIIKVLSSQSVEGLSLSSFYFQLIMVLFTIGYNLHIKAPISTYAENISVSVQTAILIVLHWKLNPKTSKACVAASIVAFSAIGTVMYLDILPDRVYDFIGIINIILFLFAVVPQIKMNHQNRGTGQLAFVTVFLAWAGNLARVFTTLQEVKDPILLALFLTGVVLNGTVLLQFFIYGKKGKVEDKKKR